MQPHSGAALSNCLTLQRKFRREKRMLKTFFAAAAIGALSITAYATQEAFAAQDMAKVQSEIPANSMTVTDWYKQDVYDPSDTKIGEVMDVLVDKSGTISTLIVGVGGFLGAGEKDVAVPFHDVSATTKNNKIRLVMNATKDSLKSAPGFKYDSNTTTWVPDHSSMSK
jgi:sporulation protein YlmC with PRC-barrel domain